MSDGLSRYCIHYWGPDDLVPEDRLHQVVEYQAESPEHALEQFRNEITQTTAVVIAVLLFEDERVVCDHLARTYL